MAEQVGTVKRERIMPHLPDLNGSMLFHMDCGAHGDCDSDIIDFIKEEKRTGKEIRKTAWSFTNGCAVFRKIIFNIFRRYSNVEKICYIIENCNGDFAMHTTNATCKIRINGIP